MFINIGDMTNMFDVTIAIYLGDTLIQSQGRSAPEIFLRAELENLIKQVAHDSRPLRVKISRDEVIWDQFEQRQKVIPCSIEFKNNHYLKWEEE